MKNKAKIEENTEECKNKRGSKKSKDSSKQKEIPNSNESLLVSKLKMNCNMRNNALINCYYALGKIIESTKEE